ncbi:MAG: bifunctional precorrin-2 dehydrogenase/sirohydrochlorin ferrochelatase [Cellulosilyticaceae bacterium]
MYPAMINITDKLMTIVGGGRVAYRKTKAFIEFGGRVRIISPLFSKKFEVLKESVQLLEREHTEEDLNESFIVVAATDDEEINKGIGEYCEARRILCNVIDDIHLSSFIVPAYIKQGDLVISVSTGGKSPSLAGKIKKELSEKYNELYIEYLDILGRIRERVIVSYDDEDKKKEILNHLVTLDIEQLKVYEQNLYK